MCLNNIDIVKHTEQGFRTLVTYDSWKVGALHYSEIYNPSGLFYFDKHLESDEVFILTKGKCTIILAGNGEVPQEITCVSLEKEYAYNIRKGTWHTHILSEDASLIIVENSDTNSNNSPKYHFSESLSKEVRQVLASSVDLKDF